MADHPKPTTLYGKNDEVRGDKLYVSCRQRPPNPWDKERRTAQHHAFTATIKQDARAKIIAAYTNVPDDPKVA